MFQIYAFVGKAIHQNTHRFMRFSTIRGDVFSSTNGRRIKIDLWFQEKQHQNVCGIEIRRYRRPYFLLQNLDKRREHLSWVFLFEVWDGAEYFWKAEPHLVKFLNLNIVNVAIFVHLNHLINVNQRRLVKFVDCSPQHKVTLFLLSKTLPTH